MSYADEIGRIGEQMVADFLKTRGYIIFYQNYRCSFGEIDIIAEDKEFIVFVEVKSRTAPPDSVSRFGPPSAAVTYAKQQRLIKAAYDYLKTSNTSKQPRMDVCEVWLDNDQRVLKINHIRNAYGR